MNRADIYVREGELDKAVADYNVTLLRDPNLADVYIARANTLIRKKDYRHGLSDLQTAVQMEIKKPERALNSLARLRARCRKSENTDGKAALELACQARELSAVERLGASLTRLRPPMPSKGFRSGNQISEASSRDR